MKNANKLIYANINHKFPYTAGSCSVVLSSGNIPNFVWKQQRHKTPWNFAQLLTCALNRCNMWRPGKRHQTPVGLTPCSSKGVASAVPKNQNGNMKVIPYDMYINTCMHACIHTYIHTYIHTGTYRYIQIHTDTYRYIQIHTNTYRYIQIHIYL